MTLVPRGLVTTDALVSTTSDVVAVAVVVVVDYDGARAREYPVTLADGESRVNPCSGVLEWRTGPIGDLEVVIV